MTISVSYTHLVHCNTQASQGYSVPGLASGSTSQILCSAALRRPCAPFLFQTQPGAWGAPVPIACAHFGELCRAPLPLPQHPAAQEKAPAVRRAGTGKQHPWKAIWAHSSSAFPAGRKGRLRKACPPCAKSCRLWGGAQLWPGGLGGRWVKKPGKPDGLPGFCVQQAPKALAKASAFLRQRAF